MKNPFDTPEWQKKFRNILVDIRQGKCILLVGPEIVRVRNKVLRSVLRDQLQVSNADDIAHYYERDGFFLFRDKVAKEDVQREVVLFYQDHDTEKDVDEKVFRQLIQIKFPLILSINPDAFLSDVAYKYSLKHRFAYFRHGGEAVQEVEELSIETPLFYNLCGSVRRDDSLVLDYDDLFQLLSSLLGSPGLPPKLAVALQQSKHFLFVGFDFDKWYSQLLLRLLSGEKAIRKIAIDPIKKNENTTTFLVKQFGIEFIKNEQLFLTELLRRCIEENLVHELSTAASPEAVQLIRLVANDELPQALELLRNIGKRSKKETLEQSAVHLLASFNHLHEQNKNVRIDSRDYRIEYNRIVNTILELIKEHL